MKKLIIYFVSIATVFVFPAFSFAQTTVSVSPILFRPPPRINQSNELMPLANSSSSSSQKEELQESSPKSFLLLLNRLRATKERIVSLTERITIKYQKALTTKKDKIHTYQTTLNKEMTAFLSEYESIVHMESVLATSSSFAKDYPSFKKKLIPFIEQIKTVSKSQLMVISELKKYEERIVTPTAVITIPF